GPISAYAARLTCVCLTAVTGRSNRTRACQQSGADTQPRRPTHPLRTEGGEGALPELQLLLQMRRRFHEEDEHVAALGRGRRVAAAFGADDEIAGSAFAFVIQ